MEVDYTYKMIQYLLGSRWHQLFSSELEGCNYSHRELYTGKDIALTPVGIVESRSINEYNFAALEFERFGVLNVVCTAFLSMTDLEIGTGHRVDKLQCIVS